MVILGYTAPKEYISSIGAIAMRKTHPLIQYGYVPLLFLGFNAVAIALVTNGFSWWWVLPLFLFAITLSFIAEHFLPYNESFNHNKGDADRDILHSITYELSVLNSVFLLPFVAMLRPWDGAWPSDWPLWQQLLMAVLMADLGYMLAHWMSHKIPLLWRFHAPHHSAERLYGFNGLIKHPVQTTVEVLVANTPLILLGLPQDVALLMGFAVGIQLLLQHSNVDFRIGPFTYILTTSRVHRFHHTNEEGKGDVNFGLFFNIWDIIFGTFKYDKNRVWKDGDLGLAGVQDYPKDFFTQMIGPFKGDMGTEVARDSDTDQTVPAE